MNKLLLHASQLQMEPGTVPLRTNTNMVFDEIEAIFEACRPEDALSRKTCIFGAEKIDTIEDMGLDIDAHIYLIEPQGKVMSLDAEWIGRAARALDEEYGKMSPGLIARVEQMAQSYWSGKITKESKIEILCETATVRETPGEHPAGPKI